MREGLHLANAQTGEILVPRLAAAQSRWEITRGLLGRPRLEPGEGLLLPGCRAVHTAFMRYALDLAYLDGQGRVVRLVHGLAPWRASMALRARDVVELPAGALDRNGWKAGIPVRIAEAADDVDNAQPGA